MICKPCSDGSHGLCESLQGSLDARDYVPTKCDCQHRMPTDPVVSFYYAAARALDYLSMDHIYPDFQLHWAQISRQAIPHSPEDLAGMAQRARNTAVHYWQLLQGGERELPSQPTEKGNQAVQEGEHTK